MFFVKEDENKLSQNSFLEHGSCRIRDTVERKTKASSRGGKKFGKEWKQKKYPEYKILTYKKKIPPRIE